MIMKKILLIEDDLDIIDGLTYSLFKFGFAVDVANTLREANKKLQTDFDLALIDVMLPDGKGFEICKKIRLKSQVPIIFLTACDEEVNIVYGLDSGADDYIVKPFKLNELISRINALFRRVDTYDNNITTKITSNGFTINLLENRVFIDKQEIYLSQIEFRILITLIDNSNTAISRKFISDKLWGNAEFVDENTLSVHIYRLRQKLETNPEKPKYIVTEKKVGYIWKVIN